MTLMGYGHCLHPVVWFLMLQIYGLARAAVRLFKCHRSAYCCLLTFVVDALYVFQATFRFYVSEWIISQHGHATCWDLFILEVKTGFMYFTVYINRLFVRLTILYYRKDLIPCLFFWNVEKVIHKCSFSSAFHFHQQYHFKK